MRPPIPVLILLSTLVLPIPGRSEAQAPAVARVHHVVIVWLKAHGDRSAQKAYIDATKTLAKLPMVSSYHVGTVLPGKRQVVDSSYDLAIHATFESRRKLDEYLVHPEHDRVIAKKLKPLVDKVVVYDFSETP
jgi:Stress responsive A/B Barrel Domain